MPPLTPDQLSALIKFVSRNWALNAAPAHGAALMARLGVSPAAAPAAYEEARAAYQAGYLATARDADLQIHIPPTAPTLAAVWRAGRAASSRKSRSRTEAVWVGAALAVGAAVTLTIMAVR